jgi:hypothetical protein
MRVARVSVIGVAMGDDGFVHRLPGVQVNICPGAVNTFFRELKQVHDTITPGPKNSFNRSKMVLSGKRSKAMARKELTKSDLLNEIETIIQSLNLLYSTIKTDRSRKPETLEEYRKKYLELLKKAGG